jgi:hypothetical protein
LKRSHRLTIPSRFALVALLCLGGLRAARLGKFLVHAYDGETGVPLARVEVKYAGTQSMWLTDSAGDASVPLRTSGDDSLDLSAVGYAPVRSRVRPLNSLPWCIFIDRVPMYPAGPRQVRGHVVDLETGRPLAGVTLSYGDTNRAVTNAEGRFLIDGAPPERFTLAARRRDCVSGSVVVAERSAGPKSILLRLFPSASAGWIEGLVTYRHSGRPMPGIAVDLVGAGLGATTDTAGKYRFAAPQGIHQVAVSGPGADLQTRDSVAVRRGSGTTADFSVDKAVRMERHITCVDFWPRTFRPVTRTHSQFELFRIAAVWPSATLGQSARPSSSLLHRVGRLELGRFAIAVQRERWPTVSVGCRLFEWFDEGGTRLGQPAVLPVYLTVADGPWTNGLFHRRPPRRAGWSLGRPLRLGNALSVGDPSFYAYVMGSASRSVGAGIGAHARVYSRLGSRLHLIPGLELSWRHSWNGQSRFSVLSLGVSLGLGSRELPPESFRV